MTKVPCALINWPICYRNAATARHVIERNLIEICDTLRKKGKQVCLATAATTSETNAESAILNSALQQFCERCAKLGCLQHPVIRASWCSSNVFVKMPCCRSARRKMRHLLHWGLVSTRTPFVVKVRFRTTITTLILSRTDN